MDQKLLEIASDVVEEIKRGDVYQTYETARTAMEKSAVVKPLLTAFSKAKEAYESVRRYGTHHPDFSARAKALQEARVALYGQPEVIEFINAEKALQTMLETLTSRLAEAVSTRIPVKTKTGVLGGGSSCTNA